MKLNIYFLNFDLSYSRSGIENSALFRSVLFDNKLGLNVVFLTAKYNPKINNVVEYLEDINLLSSNTSVVSLYNFYQSLCSPLRKKLVLSEEFFLSKVDFFLKEQNKISFSSKVYNDLSRVKNKDKKNQLESLDFYIDKVLVRRVVYDADLNISSIIVFDIKSKKTICQIYFRSDATVALIKRYYLSGMVFFEVYNNDDEIIDFFKDEVQLTRFFLKLYFSNI